VSLLIPFTQAKLGTSSRPAVKLEAPVPCPLSQQQNESVPFGIFLCKAKQAVRDPLRYIGTVGQQQP